MKGYSLVAALVTAICVTALPLPATALGGVNDPGFSYVDVNNDGLYNPADGDIGLLSVPSVDIDALITNDGHFDTSQSEGNYHAPCYPVSLVISATRETPLTVPISLKAGVNLIVFGRLATNQSITLQACRNIDLSGSQEAFGTQMTINAGQDVFLDGANIAGGILGDNLSSKLYVSAGRNISARKILETIGGLPIPTGTNIADGSLVSLCAGGTIYMDGSNIATANQTSASVSLTASGSLEALDGTNIATQSEGDIVARSQCSFVSLENDNVNGKTLLVDAYSNAEVDSSFITTSGATTIQANGQIDGNSAIVSCSDLKVSSCNSGVTLDSSNIFADPGSIQVTGRSDVTANDVIWSAGSGICVTSTCGNIDAQTANMAVTTLLGPINFYAGGGLIIVTGSVFVGTVTYGPYGVAVIGPSL